jgi:hypothetical protein
MGGPARHGNTVTVAGRRITVCRPGIVRVASGDGPAAGPPSLVAPRDWPEAPFDVGGDSVVRLTTTAMRLDIATDPVRLAVAAATGAPLLHEPASGGLEDDAGSTSSWWLMATLSWCARRGGLQGTASIAGQR